MLGNTLENSIVTRVKVNSRDRISKLDASTSSTYFSVALNQTLGGKRIKRISLRSLIMANTSYNINAFNNVLVVVDSAPADITLTITPGQYTLAQLITALEAAYAASAGLGVLTITEGANTNILTFTNTITMGLYNHRDRPASTMSNSLGIFTTTANQASNTADSHPLLAGLTQVYIKSRYLCDNNYSYESTNRLELISHTSPMNVIYGDVLYYEPNDLNMTSINYPSGKRLSNLIDIELLDQNYDRIELFNRDVELQFLVYYNHT